MTDPNTLAHFTGWVTEWNKAHGYGTIKSNPDQDGEVRRFYAHIRAFIGECACGHKHSCDVQQGMRVEFTSMIGARRKGPLPAALQIVIKQ